MRPKLVIDAGPLIATLFKKDRYHQQAIIGFNKLKQEQQKLILPLPIVFEVHRWLLQKQGAMLAQTIFAAIDRSFEIYTIKESDFQSIKAIALHFSDWSGTLADASVVYVAITLKCPIWTLDYRDLGCFKSLSFWTP